MKRLIRFKLFKLLFLFILSTGMISGCGCGRGGGGGDGGGSPNPAEGSTWDQMGWDQGKWG
jgi:hypothetical protein